MKSFIKRRKKGALIFSILGVVLMIASVVTISWWETSGRAQLLYSEVVVLNQSVEADTTITEDMLEVIKIDPGIFIEGAVVDKEKVIGKTTTQYIPKYSQLNLEYFTGEKLESAKEDQYIFTIPADWIITFPNSLRRGDIIYFYPVKIEDEKGEESKSFNISSSIKVTKESDLVKSEVAYLKDSGNREVVDTVGEERYDASANIASIEIITNWKDFSYLQGLAYKNYKFIILYKYQL